MRWQWDRFSAMASFIWGDDWQHEFLAVSRISGRTLARWKLAGVVSNGPACAMLDAFAKLNRAGMVVPTAGNPRPV